MNTVLTEKQSPVSWNIMSNVLEDEGLLIYISKKCMRLTTIKPEENISPESEEFLGGHLHAQVGVVSLIEGADVVG